MTAGDWGDLPGQARAVSLARSRVASLLMNAREATMPAKATSLMDILDPPRNAWLRALSAGRIAIPPGIRILHHVQTEEDAFERNERVRTARRKLHEFSDH